MKTKLQMLPFLFASLFSSIAVAEEQKPNVVFILADDLGWSDTELYGSSDFYQTPNVLRLSKRGMTFSRAYSASPFCSPTRASILTGLHPARIGLTTPSCHLPNVILKSSQGIKVGGNMPSVPNTSVTRLDTKYYSMAEAFREQGYTTGHFGKWHLGHEPYSPIEHGFDIDIPHWPGPGPAGSYVAPWRFPDFDPDTPNEHIEDRMAKEAVAFIEKNKGKPFFLNYWMFSVHAPFDAKKSLIQKYRKILKPDGKQRSPTYAGMVESMDDAVGTLLDALEKNGLIENTIIVFFSDNGGNMYNEVDGVPATNNWPLRGGKATMFEGGIRVPCIVSFPGRIDPGSRCTQLIQSTDFFPTLLELAELQLKKRPKFDGDSFAKVLLKSDKSNDSRALFTYFPHQPKVPDWIPPSACIHMANWKLIRIFGGGPKGTDRHLLFDLDKDPSEKRDLAQAEGERVAQLSRLLDEKLENTNAVIPRKNPNFDYTSYDFDREGEAVLKKTGQSRKRNPMGGNKQSSKRVRQPLVAGWHPDSQCRLKSKNNALEIQSLGNDPHLSFDFEKPLPKGKYELNIKMASNAKGTVQFFWQEEGVNPRFIRHRSKIFEVKHDNKSYSYSIKMDSPNPILAVRLDPARSKGTIIVEKLTLKSEQAAGIDLLRLKQK